MPESERPSEIGFNEAVKAIAEMDKGAANEQAPDPAPEAVAEGDDAPEQDVEASEAAADSEGEAAGDESAAEETVTEEEPPEFWTADEKANWNKVPAEVREVIKAKEAERARAVDAKMRETADAKKAMEAELAQYKQHIDTAAGWWQQNGPLLVQRFTDKWANVDMNKLAQENPAEWARLKQEQETEANLIRQAHERAQRDVEDSRKRQEASLQEAKRSEHAKLAERLPEYFGADKAQNTYDKLGKYLQGYGLPPERINAIHEAAVIEIAHKAMRWDEAQKQASAAKAAAKNPATQTPTRVQPGAAERPANRSAEAVRQARARLRANPGDTHAAAALIQKLGL